MELARIGLEAGPLSQWLHSALCAAGFEVVLLETRHVKAALSAMTVKTDRKDARGIAQLLRMGWFRSVHRKSPTSQEVRALLVGRKLLQSKLRDVEQSIRGILRGFGLKVGEVSKGQFAARIRELAIGFCQRSRHDRCSIVPGVGKGPRRGRPDRWNALRAARRPFWNGASAPLRVTAGSAVALAANSSTSGVLAL